MKRTVLTIILGLIFLVVFNAIFFYFGGTERTETEWISYGSIHFAYLCILLTPLFCKKEQGRTVLNASLYLRAIFYFIIALITGAAFIGFNPESAVWPAIVQGSFATIFLVMQIMSVMANDVTDKSLAQQTKEQIYVRDLATKMREAMQQEKDAETRKKLRNIYEMLNSASTGSCPEAADIELELSDLINSVCLDTNRTASSLDESTKTISGLIRKRNSIILKNKYN